MKKMMILCAAAVAIVAFSAGTAEAQTNVACFDWECTGLSCTFDASCSQINSGTLWRYRWVWGDGSLPFLTSSVTTSHTYPTGSGNYHTVDFTIVLFGATDVQVSCQVETSQIGPPQVFSGRCST